MAEGRPSVLARDSVYAWEQGTSDYEYEGKVFCVEKDALILFFHPDFHAKSVPVPLI